MVLVLKPFPSIKITLKDQYALYNENSTRLMLSPKLNVYIVQSNNNNQSIFLLDGVSLHCPIVFAILLFAEYPSDMHWRILSGSIPPPLSERRINNQTFKTWNAEKESRMVNKRRASNTCVKTSQMTFTNQI